MLFSLLCLGTSFVRCQSAGSFKSVSWCSELLLLESIQQHFSLIFSVVSYYAVINRDPGPYEEVFVLCQNKYFPYGPKSLLIRALLYNYPNKTV